MKKVIMSLMYLSLTTPVFAGYEAGGGDPCENKIKVYRDDILSWIEEGGHAGLKLAIDFNEYKEKMKLALSNTKIECVRNKKVKVFEVEKACFFETVKSKSKITCDYDKILDLKDETELYKLTHHEFAGAAGLERPNKSDSNYEISDQIEGFLTDKIVKRLSIKKQDGVMNTLNSRKFKFLPFSGTVNEFGVAWGLKGNNLDFEKIEKMSTEEFSAFYDKNFDLFENYIVNLESNVVLYKFENNDNPILNVHNTNYGQNHNYELKAIAIGNIDGGSVVPAIIEGFKWSSDFSGVYLKNKYYEFPVASFQKQIEVKLSKSARRIYSSGAIDITKIEVLINYNELDLYSNQVDYFVSSRDEVDPTLDLKVKFKLELINNKLVAKVLNVKEKISK